jgi:carbonic anhydrase
MLLQTTLTPDAALQNLRIGNRRYTAGRPIYGRECWGGPEMTVVENAPLAIVLRCHDLSVPLPLIFDQPAANLLEYACLTQLLDQPLVDQLTTAILSLGVPLLLVLGAASCSLAPRDRSARIVDNLLFQLRFHCPPVAQAIRANLFGVTGGVYDAETGVVEFI